MAIMELTQSNFDNVVSQHDLIIIDFWASWCAPCLTFTKIIEEVEKDYPEVVFGSVNIEKEKRLAEEFNVKSIPAVMILRDRVVVFAESGALPREGLRELIEKAKDMNTDILREAQKQKARE
ncbi:thioredoxin family protein [Coxiella burnetii]|uniref:thioredoxin family protein n=1 Tax=Coxiella burnetii TaxID=777 RepID=UPI0003AA624C|nr:thioredoxin family protein [Coxiella burnetii]